MAKNSGNRVLIVVVGVLALALVCLVLAGVGLVIVAQQNLQAVSNSVPVAANPVAPRQDPVAPLAPAGGLPALQAGKNVLRVPGGTGAGSDPPTLDPALAGDAESSVYTAEMFSGLVTLDPNLKVVPDIASSWDVSDDRTVYTFHLRKDVKFQDGRPVTAQDFKYSFERVANPATASPTADTYMGDIVGFKDRLNGKAQDVKGVQVVDDYTLKVTIDAPKAYFLAKMTFPTAFVVDKNNIEKGGRTWTDHPNGTGPFMLKEYVRGQRIVLVKNPYYYLDPKPSLDEIDFILGGGSFMTMYENGDIDTALVTISDVERVQDPASPLNKELHAGPELSTCYLAFNVNKPPFDDVNVRKAFSMAIDKQQLVNVVFKKMAQPAYTILPPGMPGYTDPESKTPFNPSQAKQALAQSKYAGKMPDITWTTTGGGGAASQDVQAIVGMLKDNLGVNIQITQQDWATFLGQLNDPKTNPYQMFDICWIADYADPQDFIDVLFHSGSVQNWGDYSNPAVDKIIDQAGVEKDTATRFKLYSQAEQMILSDVPVIPLTYQQQYWVTKPYVKGMIYPPIVIPKFRYVSISK